MSFKKGSAPVPSLTTDGAVKAIEFYEKVIFKQFDLFPKWK